MSSIYQESDSARDFPIHNVPMRHAFAVVGEDTLFLCHLINWWMEGHNAAFVVRISVDEDSHRTIVEDPGRTTETHFLANLRGDDPRLGKFTLPWLVRRAWEPDPGDRTFRASVWRGFGTGEKPSDPDPDWLPWDADEPLLDNVEIRIDAIVWYQHINENRSEQDHEQYLLFGAGSEGHLYHLPAREPDYDHVATLDRSPTWLQPDQLETGVVVSVEGLKWKPEATYCKDPLGLGQHMVLYHGIRRYKKKNWDGTPAKDELAGSYPIRVSRTWWHETFLLNYRDPKKAGQCT